MGSTKLNNELWEFSLEFIENGFDIYIKGSEIFSIKLLAELWKLEIGLETKWQVLQTLELRTELQTEGEELMFTSEIVFNSITSSFTFVMNPQNYLIDFIYKIDDEEVGKLSLKYQER